MMRGNAAGRGISDIRGKGVRPFSPIVIPNLFQDNKPRLRVIPKQVRDNEGGGNCRKLRATEGAAALTQFIQLCIAE